MIVLPAIDILGGKCVRLKQGRYGSVTEYSDDPLAVARSFVEDGAAFLHVVDLDGAKEGRPVNRSVVCEIACLCDLQVGGGIRSFEDAAFYLENGVKRVILSTSAVTEPSVIKKIVQRFGGDKVIVSVDVKDSEVMIKGWEAKSGLGVEEFLERLGGLGVEAIIVTDVTRDGVLEGPNLELYLMIIDRGFEVIAAGGISSYEDLSALRKCGLTASISGKAIYEGRINLRRIFGGGLAKRIIPCLDIDAGRVVKGVNFKNLRDAGDPVELAKFYESEGADELVFLDITATLENRKTLYDLVEKIAENISIPFTVGGGVKTIEDIRELLKAGADKVSLGSIAVKNKTLVSEAAQQFGSQCVVISVDCKRRGEIWEIFIRGGRDCTSIDVADFVQELQALGAGELLVNSLDRDGTKHGFDVELISMISGLVNIPVIASSGAGCMEDFEEVFKSGSADAGLAASIFHFGDLSIGDLKAFLLEKNLTIRL